MMSIQAPERLVKLPDVLTLSQAAQLFSVSAATLRRWDESGYLRAMRVGPKKIRKYYREDVAYRLMEMGFIQ